MGEMVDRVARWLYQREATEAEQQSIPWSEAPKAQKDALTRAARDFILTLRRPTLGMRVQGRIVRTKADEGETWRAMIDGALQEDD